MKKSLALFVTAIVALLLTVSFAQDYENVDPSGQNVVFWYQHTRDRADALTEIIATFNETNEYGITVSGEYQGGYGDINKKMVPVLGTSDAPNLVVAYQNQAATYALGDGMLDMNTLVNSPKWGLSAEDQADFFSAFLNADIFPSFDNARYGFPPNRSLEVMYYNSDWLAELGYDGPPTTFDEFKEMACAATANPYSKATSEGSLGYELSIDASRFASWTFAFDGNIFDYDAGQYTYDSPAAIEAMTYLQGLFDDGCGAIVTERYGDQSNFGAGRTLFTVGSTSGLPFYRSAVEEGAAFDWSIAPLPQKGETHINLYGASISMASGHTPEQDLATWIFVKYYTSPEVQAKWAEASNYFPVRESVAANMGDYFEANPVYQKAFGFLQYGQTEPPMPGYDEVRSMIASEMAAIMDGEDVESTLKLASAEANFLLAEQLGE